MVQRGEAWAGWAPPSPHLAVPNVTAHPSMASVPTSYYLMWQLLLPLDSKGLISTLVIDSHPHCLRVTDHVNDVPGKGIIMKLSEENGNGSGIMSLNSLGGSTLQWGVWRGLSCLAALVCKLSFCCGRYCCDLSSASDSLGDLAPFKF